MPVKIRLTRQGRKKKPFYHIVIADSRAPRDGRYIERIGLYNPNTNPATIEIDFDRALKWMQDGAQPTETCRAILSYKGVLMKKHLLEGVQKEAFSEEEAETRFSTWLKEKEATIEAKRERVAKGIDEERKKRIREEEKIREAKALEIAKKNAALAEEAARASGDEPVREEASPEPVEAKLETTAEEAPDTAEEELPSETVEAEAVSEETPEKTDAEPGTEDTAPEEEAEEDKTGESTGKEAGKKE